MTPSRERVVAWLRRKANELRLSKGGFMYFWRSHLDPIWNHYIRGPVRIWSIDDGPDERALTALGTRDLESLERLIPEPADERADLARLPPARRALAALYQRAPVPAAHHQAQMPNQPHSSHKSTSTA